MSDTVDGLQSKLVIDPRVDSGEVPTYYIEKAADYVRYYQDPAQSNVNTSSINFSIVPPNKNIYVDKKMYITMDCRFTFTGDAGLGNLLLPQITVGGQSYIVGETDALRWMPLQSITESLQIVFNQTTVSQNLSDYIEALARCGFSKEYEGKDWSLAPSMHDQFQDLGDWVQWGGARNPLTSYGNNASQLPRGGLEYRIVSNTQLSAVVDVQWTEPVLMSPLAFSKLNKKAFLGLTNIDITWNLGRLSRMWSHDAVNNPVFTAEPTVTFNNPPRMRLLYLTPPIIEHPLPMTNKYPYFEIQRFPTNLGTINAGVSTGIRSTNNIQLSSIPKRIFLFCRERNADRNGILGYTLADSYFNITQLRVNFDNKNALLGSAASEDLYSLSVKNGLMMDYQQFSRFSGSIIVLDFGQDISLDAYQSVGMHGQFQLQVDFDVTNISQRNINADFYMVVISEGVFTISNTETSLEVGNVRRLNVFDAAKELKLERLPYHEAYDFQGGSFWSSLKDFARRAAHTVGSIAQRAAPYVQKGVQVAEALAPMLMAAGYSDAEIKEALKGSGITGAGITGGRKMRRSGLKRRI